MMLVLILLPLLVVSAPTPQLQIPRGNSQDVLSGVELLRLFSKASESIAHKHYHKKLPVDAKLSMQLEQALSTNTLHTISATNRVSKANENTANGSDTKANLYNTFLEAVKENETTNENINNPSFTLTTDPSPVSSSSSPADGKVGPLFFNPDEDFGDKVIGGDVYVLPSGNEGVSRKTSVKVSVSVDEEAQGSQPNDLLRREPKVLVSQAPNIRQKISTTEKYMPTPAKQWGTPSKIWGAPEKVWGEPAKVWGEPSLQWGEPAKQWGKPAEQWGSPSVNWANWAPTTSPPVVQPDPTENLTEPEFNKEFVRVEEGQDFKRYHLQEDLTPSGYVIGEFGIFRNNGNVRGVRYTADQTINPNVIYKALRTFLSLPSKES